MNNEHQVLLRSLRGLGKRAVLAALLLMSYCDLTMGTNQGNEPRVPKAEYSAKEPAEWARYAADHPPRIEISLLKQKDNVGVFVYFNEKDQTHYIESVGLMDSEGNVVVSQSFGPTPEKSFNAHFTLSGISSRQGYKAYAKCSRHDLWVTPIEEARFIDGKSPF